MGREIEASRGGGGWGRPNTNLERPGREVFDAFEASRGGGWGRPNTKLEKPGRDFFDFEASRGGWGKPNIKLEKPGREMYASRGGGWGAPTLNWRNQADWSVPAVKRGSSSR